MSSMWGERIRISIFGGSHTAAIGVTVDGLPAGEPIDLEAVARQMARRAPGTTPTATARRESDRPQILCGLLDGVLTGAPLTAVLENRDTRSKDYSDLKRHPRPGHADYTAFVRYGGFNDIRGGGHFSGRLTAPLVFAGAVARQILARRGVFAASHVLSVGPVTDRSLDPVQPEPALLERLSQETFPVLDPAVRTWMEEAIASARAQGDSLGGVVEAIVAGLPAGLGDPMFDGVENLFASLLFGIPAVKGVEFGAGFAAAGMTGSQNNDPFYTDGSGCVRTRGNHAGGSLGGITTGMPVVFRVAFKPTPSIAQEQETVDLSTGESARLTVSGRHDPCIVPRAAPVVEAAACLAALELMARQGLLTQRRGPRGE